MLNRILNYCYKLPKAEEDSYEPINYDWIIELMKEQIADKCGTMDWVMDWSKPTAKWKASFKTEEHKFRAVITYANYMPKLKSSSLGHVIIPGIINYTKYLINDRICKNQHK